MPRAEVVDATHQVHPRLQGRHLVSQPPTPTYQGRPPGAERGVEPLDVRRIDLPARPGPVQYPIDPSEAAPDRVSDHLGQTPTAVLLDHLPQQQPPGQAVWRAATPPGVNLLAGGTPEGRYVAGQPIDADQQGPPRFPGQPPQIDQPLDEPEIPNRADDTAQPEPMRHGQGHGQPAASATVLP